MSQRTTKVTLTAEVNGYLAGMEKANKATRATANEAEKLAAQKAGFDELGRSALAVGAVITTGFGLAAKAAMDWESAWTGVLKTVDGTPEQLAAIEEGLRNMARELPASHEEIAAVAEAAGQLGIQTDNVLAFTKTMIDLGETTNMSAEEAAKSLARFSNIMGTSQGDFDRLGSAIVGLGNNYATTEGEIVAMSMRLAGAGKQAGLTEGDVLGMAAAMSSVGIEAEAGGTAMSLTMKRIAKEVETGGDKLGIFAEVAGMSSTEFAKAWKDDAAGALTAFVEGLAKTEKLGKSTNGVLLELGVTGIRESDALLRLSGAQGLLNDAMQKGNADYKENNALLNEAEKRYATVESQLGKMQGAVNDAAISVGSILMPAIADASESVAGFAGFIADLPEPITGVLTVVGSLTGGVALLGGGLLLAIPRIHATRMAMQQLNLTGMGLAKTIGKGGLLLLGVAAVSSGLAALGDQTELTAEDVAKLNNAVSQGGKELDAMFTGMHGTTSETNGLADALDKVAGSGFNSFIHDVNSGAWKFVDGITFGLIPAIGDLNDGIGKNEAQFNKLGDQLGTLAETDLQSAQAGFKALVAQTDGSEESVAALLEVMPGYRAALVDVLTEQGKSATEQEILNLAMGKGALSMILAKRATQTAAGAYAEAKAEVAKLTDELDKLIDLVNEANGVNQDAVSANANYQSSLAGIADEVQRQKDAYEEANGSLSGFVLSLDESTAAGSANAAMLTGVAADAQTAALAQFEVDKRTMSATDATTKYLDTLADSRAALIEQAIQNGYTADEVQKLIDKVYSMPTQAEIDILIDTATPEFKLNQWITVMSGKRIKLGVDMYGGDTFRFDPSQHGLVARAEGGILPGAPSSKDNMLIAAASGEFVVNAAATVRNRALLEAINSGRGYADGGYVQPRYAAPSFASSGSAGAPASVSLAGATLVAEMDGVPFRLMIRDQIVDHSRTQSLTVSNRSVRGR